MTRLAMLDCDGALVDGPANICAIEEACVSVGLTPPPRALIRRIDGLSLIKAMRALRPAGDGAQHRALAGRHPSKPDRAMLLAGMAKAGVAPHMTAMIGDISFDMTMARSAGCRAVGVAWGYHSTDKLADSGADAIAQHASDLVAMLA
ncbi:MAG: haloacid dehalogenase [Sphingomonas bacterium]|uniref:HAD hydrolase-like protein n=1 Tax=Sphingomonas bacterium TaxID=1895847 RepID=UPI00260EDA41|nr:HAD hydrolase-like protein [Sphingomonas bacterium]MDB5695346.1 haloacid dehalogenase [Sphingomonas bacterium]